MIALRRLAALLCTLLIVSGIIFAVLEVLPGDPAAIVLGTSATPEKIATLRHEMALDRPAPLRYLAWLGGLATGDLGTSLSYGVPVSGLIAERSVVTVPLALLAMLLAMGIGLPLGTAAAASRGGWPDVAAAAFAQAGISVPSFWIGLLLILGLSLELGWLPADGFPGWSSGFWHALRFLVLPAIALGVPQAAVLTRVTRAAVSEVMNDDFVRTARAKGLSRRQALRRHVLPNALGPVVTIAGLQVSFLVAGAVLVENVFTLPGLGRLAWQALAQRDLVVIKDVVLILAAAVVVLSWTVDGLAARLDPRLRRPA